VTVFQPHEPAPSRDGSGSDRRRFLTGLGALGVAGLAGCSTQRDRFKPTATTEPASTTTTETTTTTEPGTDPYFEAGPSVSLEPVLTDLVLPNAMAAAPGGGAYVTDQVGVVYGLGSSETFMDISDRVLSLGENLPNWVAEDERGLLGIAFHPEYAANGRFFLRYSADPLPEDPDTVNHRERLSEFRANDDRTGGRPESERVLLELPWERPIHQAGSLDFGPDGYLYAALGDGLNPWNGQDIESLKGSILRLDVDGAEDGKPYAVPEDNPLVGGDGLPELYAWGLRNPWKMGFSGDRLIAGDVGQELFEEVDIIERGANYGWPFREGLHCHDPTDPSNPPETCRSTSERGEPLVDPVVEFPHFHNEDPVGFAVIGGYVYEGTAVPALEGEYVFGAFTQSFSEAAGRLLTATPRASGTWPTRSITVDGSDTLDVNILGIGRGPDGELYVLGTGASISERIWTQQKGVVYRVTA